MEHDNRPLSPDLQIYRPQLTSVLSIMHRLTGVALCAGSLLLVAWLVAGSAGPTTYHALLEVLRSWGAQALLFGWTFSLFYHLCNGIRHLCWDAGYGFSLTAIYASGWTVVVMSTILTLVTWFAGRFVMGGGI